MTISNQEIINKSGYSIFFPVIDPYLSLDLPQLKNVFILSAKNTKHKSSPSLLADPKTIQFISQTCQQNQTKPAIMPFKPSAKIEFLCRQYNWKLLANPRKLNLMLEDKINFSKLCQKYNISTIPNSIDRLTAQNVTKYQQTFDQTNLIIQTKTGWAGNSTYLVNDPTNLPLPSNTLVKFSPYLEGKSLILNACLYRSQVIYGPLARQLNNPKHSSNIFATTGRSWPVDLDQKVTDQIKIINQKVNHLFGDLNYRAFFGLDYFVDTNNKVYLLECNPRLTASFNFYTQLELKNNLTPLLYFHIAEFLNLKLNFNQQNEQDRFLNKNITGTQISLRNAQGKISKQIIKHV